MKPAMRRLVRAPLLHFLLLGALMHGVLALRPETIVLDDRDLAEIDAQWFRETGRAPTPPEQAASRQRAADEEMLVREGLRLGLDERDPVVRARLLRNIALIAPDTSDALAHARRLDMAARDVLARRRLVQLMEARLSATSAPLSRADLDTHIEAHPQRYAKPARSSFEHVFLSRDRALVDDAGLEAEAGRIADALRAGTLDPSAAGDAFAVGRRFESATNARLSRLFGSEFAETVTAAPLGEWVQAPSVFGLHLVRVSSRDPAAPASPRDAGAAAVWGAIEERERIRLRQGIEGLRAHYRVVIGDRA